MTRHPPDRVRRPPLAAGFTLVELLVVVAVMGLLLAMIIPSVSALREASLLTSTIDGVSGSLHLARQSALTRRRPVAVRFFKMAEEGSFSACQLFILDEDGSEQALARMQRFPDGVVVSSRATHSSALQTVIAAEAGAEFPFYSEFWFRRDGTIDLDPGEDWFLSVIREQDEAKERPDNFAILLLDPLSGTSKLFRP